MLSRLDHDRTMAEAARGPGGARVDLLAVADMVEHGARVFNQPTCHHAPEIYPGIDEERAAALLQAFFQARR